MPIALNYLGCDRDRGHEPECADRPPYFDCRIQVSVGSDGSRDLTDAHAVPRADESRAVPSQARSNQTASLRPKVIGSACTPWVRPIIGVWLMLQCPRSRTAASSASQIGKEHVARLPELKGECRVEDVRRRQPEMQPSRGWPHVLGDSRGKGNDVVPRDLFELFDPCRGDRAALSRMSRAASSGITPSAGHCIGGGAARLRATCRSGSGRSKCAPSLEACIEES